MEPHLLNLLAWVDNRTLLGCLVIMTGMFATVFCAVKRMYPHAEGSGHFALGYLAALLACILFTCRGVIPAFLTVVVANILVFVCFTVIYQGILNFFGVKRRIYPLWVLVGLAALPLTWFSVVHNEIVPRAVIISLLHALIRGLIAIELFRQARGRPLLALFGYFMTLYGLTGLNRAAFVLVNGIPGDFMAHNTAQSALLLIEVIFICIMGLFKLLMLYGGLLSQIQKQSFQDPLSGALNRRGIEDKLVSELKRISRSHQKLSIALIDVDHFKAINDTQGHAAGDAALRGVVDAISERLRAYDYLGRFGGDEFLLLLPQTPWRDSQIVADRVDHAVRQLTVLPNGQTLTISIGITEAIPSDDATTVLARADKALYQAKTAGRSCSRVLLAEDAVNDLLLSASQPHMLHR
jgi:diguanylate cyclase (GGDEF)-like protein